MKTNLLSKAMILLAVASFSFFSCEKDETTPDITINNLKGMFVVCEGSFSTSNADITYYNPDSLSSIKGLYEKANGSSLGSILQSFAVVDTMGFLVVTNSQKVTVVNMKNFKKIKSIDGFSYPRNIIKATDDVVYISNGNGHADNYVYSVSLKTLTKTDSIEVGTGPEKMVKVNNKVYVANSGGYTNSGNIVSIINTTTFKANGWATVGNVPTDLVVDANNNVWAYCKGIPDYTNYPNVTYSGSTISKIATNNTVTSFSIPAITTMGINCLAIDNGGKTLYFVADGTYKMSINDTQLPTTKFHETAFYGIEVDPSTGNIIGLDDVNSKARILNTEGTEIKNFDTGLYPNAICFEY